ncbi:hypothetical protein [Chlamydia felis Fe/C-56]|uniref:Uncharacterized protein n=1 Tax=Chlamydia felis (strain Fe/C-56) TaxID=264202 RepID=Q253Q9_CHLFF|nr:hypothetical protein [Chlamydia felis]BAE81479.1 hypothetical protein [Chlamydia felis Fe/C-56]
MCAPIASCGFNCSAGAEGSSEGSQSCSNGVSHPITTQPKSKLTLEVKFGEDGILDTIAKAGNLLESVLSSPRTQRGATYCQQHCGPWCESHCPNWLSHCFQCLCTCVIDEPSPSSDDPDLSLFLSSMRQNHGPIVLGLALQQSPHNFPQLLAEGSTLNQEDKDDFNDLCSRIAVLFANKLMGGIQEELFNLANDPGSIPEKGCTDTLMAKRGYNQFKHGIKNEPPQCWISYPSITEEESTGTASTVCHVKSLDFVKLKKQLAHLEVIPVNDQEVYPLGKESEKVVSILKNTLFSLSAGAECFSSSETGFGLTFTHTKLLDLILLSLLAAGYVPTDNQGLPPLTLGLLKELSHYLRRQEPKSATPQEEQSSGLKELSETEMDGGSPLSSEIDPSTQNNTDWFTSQNQEDLLTLASKVNSLSQLLG